jgi:hypothetical protein
VGISGGRSSKINAVIRMANMPSENALSRSGVALERGTWSLPLPCAAAEPDAISNAIGYAKFYSRSHDAVIRVYDETGNVTETQEHAGDFREW